MLHAVALQKRFCSNNQHSCVLYPLLPTLIIAFRFPKQSLVMFSQQSNSEAAISVPEIETNMGRLRNHFHMFLLTCILWGADGPLQRTNLAKTGSSCQQRVPHWSKSWFGFVRRNLLGHQTSPVMKWLPSNHQTRTLRSKAPPTWAWVLGLKYPAGGIGISFVRRLGSECHYNAMVLYSPTSPWP